jgi:hypothetical protein
MNDWDGGLEWKLLGKKSRRDDDIGFLFFSFLCAQRGSVYSLYLYFLEFCCGIICSGYVKAAANWIVRLLFAIPLPSIGGQLWLGGAGFGVGLLMTQILDGIDWCTPPFCYIPHFVTCTLRQTNNTCMQRVTIPKFRSNKYCTKTNITTYIITTDSVIIIYNSHHHNRSIAKKAIISYIGERPIEILITS